MGAHIDSGASKGDLGSLIKLVWILESTDGVDGQLEFGAKPEEEAADGLEIVIPLECGLDHRPLVAE